MGRSFTRRRAGVAAFSTLAALLAGTAVWGTMTPSAHAQAGHRVCLYAEEDATWFRPSPAQKIKQFYAVDIYKSQSTCPVLDKGKFPTTLSVSQPVPVLTCEDLEDKLIDAGAVQLVDGLGDKEEEKHPLVKNDVKNDGVDPCPYMADYGLTSLRVHLEDYSEPSWPMHFKKGDVTLAYHGESSQFLEGATNSLTENSDSSPVLDPVWPGL